MTRAATVQRKEQTRFGMRLPALSDEVALVRYLRLVKPRAHALPALRRPTSPLSLRH